MDSKLPQTGTTIFTVMSQLAADAGALNLSQGFPEFDPDPALIEAVARHMRDGANQYAPMMGVPELREAISEKVWFLYGRKADADTEVTVCSGATEGLFSAIHAIVRPGDDVIVFDPAYDSYEPSVTLAGGVTRHLPLVRSADRDDLHIDFEALATAINERTRLLILNFPHNPTGAVLETDDLTRLADTLRDTGIFILSDEVYEHIVFDGKAHMSMLLNDELWERSFVVSSFGKTYHATGWKIGYCVAPAELSAEFRKVHQWNTFATVNPMQRALADFMQENPDHYGNLAGFYQQKRDRFCQLLENSRFSLRPAAGTFFQMLDYSEVSELPDTEFARELVETAGVAAIPVSVFCEDPGDRRELRFCFAKHEATLADAAERLCRL